MKKVMFLTLVALLVAVSGNAFAQGDNSVYFVTYYSNNVTAAPDETVRFINDGDSGANLYAAFYVFDDSQELAECCACVITPDGLLSESVRSNLTANPITGKVPKVGVIKTISSSSSDPTNVKPVSGLRGWATHIQAKGSTYYVTETPVADSNLTSTEQTLLQNLCYYSTALSGKPCTCTPEDQNF